MTALSRIYSALIALLWLPPSAHAAASLIVVDDRGGVTAAPYYQALHLLSTRSTAAQLPAQQPLIKQISGTDWLPVRSVRLSPGAVAPRRIQAPGLTPLFLIGDDPRSREWLVQHLPALRQRHAVGFVVNVNSAANLAALRQLATGLTMVAICGDDVAQRLVLRHYPVLITATAIEP